MGLTRSQSPVEGPSASAAVDQTEGLHSLPHLLDEEQDDEIDELSGASIQALFSGAPSFSFEMVTGHPSPVVSYPWDSEVRHDEVDDSIYPEQPSFMAATVRRQPSNRLSTSGVETNHHTYQTNAVEVPSWLSAQGQEPGSIGFAHFVELPQADNLVTEPQYDQASEEYLDATRNKELMQVTLSALAYALSRWNRCTIVLLSSRIYTRRFSRVQNASQSSTIRVPATCTHTSSARF